MLKVIVAAVVIASYPLSPATAADEAITYTYDARGRLITAAHAGGRNNAVTVSATFDPVENRTQYVVTGRSKNPVVVVPLNGFTVIPLP